MAAPSKTLHNHLCLSGTVDEVQRKAEELGLSYKTKASAWLWTTNLPANTL
jgi:hypothetical protein